LTSALVVQSRDSMVRAGLSVNTSDCFETL
jgi:hypothetical protein